MAGRLDRGDWWLPVISGTVGLSEAGCCVELGGASYSDKHSVALLHGQATEVREFTVGINCSLYRIWVWSHGTRVLI